MHTARLLLKEPRTLSIQLFGPERFVYCHIDGSGKGSAGDTFSPAPLPSVARSASSNGRSARERVRLSPRTTNYRRSRRGVIARPQDIMVPAPIIGSSSVEDY